MRYPFLPLVMMVTVILASGCASPAKKTLITGLNMKFGADSLLSGKTGTLVSYAEMLKDLEDSQIIYIGENHTDPVHHRIQLRVIQDLTALHQTAVGMEMFDHAYQSVLDNWSQGELSEQAFLEKTHWYANWRYDFDLYRDIFETIRDRHLHRVARGSCPPPAPTQRSVQISRTTLFRKRFTAQQWPEVPDRESKALVAAEENLL